MAVYLDLPEEFDYIRSVIFEKVLRTAERYQFEGRWIIFKEIYDLPKDETFSFTDIFYEVLLNKFSENDIFGNIFKKVRKYKKLFNRYENKLYYWQVLRPGKVKKPQRKRGYSDKGHRILYGQRGNLDHLKEITVSGLNPVKKKLETKYPSSCTTTYLWIKGAD